MKFFIIILFCILDPSKCDLCKTKNFENSQYSCDEFGNIICKQGWKNPYNSCQDPICNCIHGTCSQFNNCSCDFGWSGPQCDSCLTLKGCVHGTCEQPGECKCNFGWTGDLCNIAQCTGCLHGICHQPYDCICDAHWSGQNCTKCYASSNCVHGTCSTNPFECICDNGWTGSDCSQPICKSGCNDKNGYCNLPGECICQKGWGGMFCHVCYPYPGCNGECIDNIPWSCNTNQYLDISIPDQWSLWSPWTECSATCGYGVKNRYRFCSNSNEISNNCLGSNSESQMCIQNYCPINGDWTIWSNWSSCSQSCGTGTQTRQRYCLNPTPQYNGMYCIGSGTELLKCFLKDCSLEPNWSSWFPWQSCSVTCGKGIQSRIRVCDSHNTRDCIGSDINQQSCNMNPCDNSIWEPWSACSRSCGLGFTYRVKKDDSQSIEYQDCVLQSTCNMTNVRDSQWSKWNEWTLCSQTCGKGFKQRHRSCVHPETICYGHKSEKSECESVPCLYRQKHIMTPSALLNNRHSWSSCTVTCGGGTQYRRRICKGPCSKSINREFISCNTQPCINENGWSSWSDCSASCNGGTKSRVKYCLPSSNCTFPPPMEETSCNQDIPCYNDSLSFWSEWHPWSICSKTCEGGFKSRERICYKLALTKPHCIGSSNEKMICNTMPCLSIFQWSEWSGCSKTCDTGIQYRNRNCNHPYCNNDASQEERYCNTNKCSNTIDGTWSSWKSWSDCSLTCGHGIVSRLRDCIPPQNGGKPCDGPSLMTNNCYLGLCPTNNNWISWSSWSSCSVSCGGGFQLRKRSCFDSSFYGSKCLENKEETRACNLLSCEQVLGQWSEWLHWSPCSKSCSGGSQQRERYCGDGSSCSGSNIEMTSCNIFSCPSEATWSKWGAWSICTKSCNNGLRLRLRECNPGNDKTSICYGINWEEEHCNSIDCALISNDVWSEWDNWSTCSVTCGNGRKSRIRTCPLSMCIGNNTENENCVLLPCPIDGGLTDWSIWSQCSTTCFGDQGYQIRRRHCLEPKPDFGGKDCLGLVREERTCTGFLLRQNKDPAGKCYSIGQ